MLLFDVNVLIRAVDRLYVDRDRYEGWLRNVVEGDDAFGVSDLVLSGFLRISTNPRILKHPMDSAEALEFVSHLRDQPNCVAIQPGTRHWDIFIDLCRRVNARGNLVPDAYLAALAIGTMPDSLDCVGAIRWMSRCSGAETARLAGSA